MAPRRTMAGTSSAASSSSRSTSTVSSLPSYHYASTTSPSSPPPSYGWSPNPIFNGELSVAPPKVQIQSPSLSSSSSSRHIQRHSSSSRKSTTPMSAMASFSPPAAPLLRIMELPLDVKDAMPPAQMQSRQHLAPILFSSVPTLDFLSPPPDLFLLGSASVGCTLTELPITFPFCPTSILYVRRSSGVRIHDIAQFIYHFLHTPFSDKDVVRYGCGVVGRKMIDLLIQGSGVKRTKFGGLSLASGLGGDGSVWMVNLIS